MAEGKVKWFSEHKRYGFIAQDAGKDVFVHISEWCGPAGGLKQGDRVTFEVQQTRRGPQAVNVRPVGMESAKRASYRFLNPYNFVRPLTASRPNAAPQLGRLTPPPHDRYVELTGKIKCRVRADTLLFISDSHAIETKTVRERGRDKEHPLYRFFEYEGQPALPASGLRGMLRSVFEAATNSCFSVFAGHKRLSYHLPPDEALKLVPARVIHENGEWYLDILNGTTPVVVGQKPQGHQYAAWVKQYTPLWSSRTHDRKPNSHYSTRNHIPLGGFEHGDECQALIEEVDHPLRPFRFWNVVKIAPPDAPPLNPCGSHQQLVTGYLCITNQNIENKHDERLFFYVGSKPVRIPLSDRVRRHYRQLIEDYQERHSADVEKRRKRYEKNPSIPPPDQPEGKTPAFSRFILDPRETKLKHGALVYVMLDRVGQAERAKFIVPVSVPRVGYEQTVGNRLDPDSSFEESLLHKCRDYEHLCPACRVFGWVYGTGDPEEPKLDADERAAYAGRVRLTHAMPADGKVHQYDEDLTLAILSSPKPTTTRFYLCPTDGRPRDRIEDNQVDYSKKACQRLRGRKFYRHHGEQLNEQEFTSPSGKQSDQNRTVKGVVKPGSVFEFSLEFENLSEVELGALLWAIELDGWHHRLGLGKSLGFGSVTIKVVEMETLDFVQRYERFKSGWANKVDQDTYVEIFQKAMKARYSGNFYDLDNIRDLKALLAEPPDLPIHYPRSTLQPQPGGKNYEWFVGNKRKGGPRLVLRLATEDTDGLPLVDK